MAEEFLDVRGLPKDEAWRAVRERVDAILDGVEDVIAEMATISCVVHQGFGFLWTGFYRRVSPTQLRVGPYQGSLGCIDIALGRGVCGTAAVERRSVVVADVHAFPGHIACDARSASEIVVPVFDKAGEVIAVFDIDADRIGAFDDVDRVAVEGLVGRFRR